MSVARSDRGAAIERARAHSPFLAHVAEQAPDIVPLFAERGPDAALAQAGTLDGDLASSLRRRRSRVALIVALADLAGEWSLEQVVNTLSDEADRNSAAAARQAMLEVTGVGDTHGFAILALGKHGSRELNYSSDIDPILLFDAERLPPVRRRDPAEVALRVAKRWVALLAERTAEGYVHRVDLRLRPTPEVTPIVVPVAGAIAYYESQAVGWEQAAFIRARACAGDIELGRDFLREIAPFVWRRSADFGQLRRIGDMARRIRENARSTLLVGPGWDIKKARGGIREVEFAAQALQLIHGGRDAQLRAPATLDALRALSVAGHLSDDDGEALASAYRRYRTVEHRVQMRDDRQTHALPVDQEEAHDVAILAGCDAPDALYTDLAQHAERVAAIFRDIGGVDDEDAIDQHVPHERDALMAMLAAMKFVDCADPARRIEGWRSGGLRITRSNAARDALERVLPQILQRVASAHNPDGVLQRLDSTFAGMPSALGLIELLHARPALIDTLVAVAAHAPPLAQELAIRPTLIEAMIDANAFDPPDHATLVQAMTRGLDEGYERRLDTVRRVVAEQRFALAVQTLEARTDALAIGRGYAVVAQAAVEVLCAATIAEFERAHGRIAGAELVVLALGRLGSGLLTHASDLDIVLLFTTDDLLAESDGPRPLGATAYFNRLGQRVIAALSVPTAAGRLYEVDTRLRPEGAKGPLVVWTRAFARYQREQAWLWEHLALTRARVIFGLAAAREQVERAIDDALGKPRDAAAVRTEAAAMREEMARHKSARGRLDVKHLSGGLIDAEFAAQVLQIVHRTPPEPDLSNALASLVERRLAPADVVGAHQRLTRVLVAVRLMAPEGDVPDEATRARIAVAAGADDWATLSGETDWARNVVARWWRNVREAT